MDQSYLLLLGVAIVIAVVAAIRVRARMQAAENAATASSESPFAVSTEGEKVCPRCGMGNLWTERSCITCGAPLKG